MSTPKHTNISYQPTAGLSYDPNDDRYWDPNALKLEVTRAFEICHGCRMCFKYCDTFKDLFALIDGHECDGNVRKIDEAQTESLMKSCFQCKLCEVQCPYTPREKHPFQLDFPNLVHRYRALQAERDGVSLRDRALASPDLLGMAARASFGLANVANKTPLLRRVMEPVAGIHREKLLPDFAEQTFERWAAATGKLASDREDVAAEAVLFQTCYVQNNEPQIGRDTLQVMEKNGVDCRCVAGLQCCGMPAWEHGDIKTLRRAAKANLDKLMPYVEAGAKVLAINPTCSMLMRREYPHLVDAEDAARAKKLAAAIQDPGEYLWSIRNEPRFCSEVKSKPEGPLAYHAPCHLRAQGIGFKGRDLLRKLLDVQPVSVQECSGHDGTFAMKTEGFEPAKRVGQKAFDEMKAAGGSIWATECPLAAIQFQQHALVKPMHPMSILAAAYRGDNFETHKKDV